MKSKNKGSVSVFVVIFAVLVTGFLGYMAASKKGGAGVAKPENNGGQGDDLNNVDVSWMDKLLGGGDKGIANKGFIGNSKTVGWKMYENKEAGIYFSFPPDFTVVKNEIVTKFSGGKVWRKIELKGKGVGNPYLTMEVNPDGYGPFFPNMQYGLTIQADGGTRVDSTAPESTQESETSERFLIVGTASNDNFYSWRFSYDKSGPNYEKVFQDILKTFVIGKNIVGAIKNTDTVIYDASFLRNGRGSFKFRYPMGWQVRKDQQNTANGWEVVGLVVQGVAKSNDGNTAADSIEIGGRQSDCVYDAYNYGGRCAVAGYDKDVFPIFTVSKSPKSIMALRMIVDSIKEFGGSVTTRFQTPDGEVETYNY